MEPSSVLLAELARALSQVEFDGIEIVEHGAAVPV
jgi:hypothetical protein